MQRINLANPELSHDPEDPEAYRVGQLSLRKALGSEQTGATLWELAPGQSICPYHYEVGEEEWLLVLAGNPTLRHPEGRDRLEPLDALFFPRGPAGAHKVTNETAETVRVLMFSDLVVPSATVYPDSDKIGVWTGDEATDLLVRRSAGVSYYDGEA
ncbi:MAG: cupin domain-containing protein [Solirubrobacterales bacterium]